MSKKQVREVSTNPLPLLKRFEPLIPKTSGQKEYCQVLKECIGTICLGPAGTGKTALALSEGLKMLLVDKKCKQLVLTRPLWECGRNLGAMPGEKDEKLAPHMVAFAELFSEHLSMEQFDKLVSSEKIIIEALEFMRGRTFKDTYLIVDEAQNCEYKQLVMALTRVGENSKIVIAGDSEQTDLREGLWHKGKVPLEVIADCYWNVDDEDKDSLWVVELTEDDIVRSEFVKKVYKYLKK